MSRAILQQALDALKDVAQTLAWQQWGAHLGYTDNVSSTSDAVHIAKTAISALEAELAKPDPEPVGYVYWNKGHAEGAMDTQNLKPGTPLYAAPTESNCRFPTCHSQEFQTNLANDVASELVTGTNNCSRHPDAPHGPDGAGCKCHSWAPGDAS